MINFFKSFILVFYLFTVSCGQDDSPPPRTSYEQKNDKVAELEKQYTQLAGTLAEITGILNNDFTTCATSLDDLIEKICKISQDAGEEKRNLLKSELLNVISVLETKLDAISNNIGRSDKKLQDVSDSLYGSGNTASCVAAENCLSTSIAGRLKQAQTDITTLNNLTSAIQGTVNRTLESIEIGTENLTAGPGYESVTRRVDRVQINAYVEVRGSSLSVSNDGISATNGSSTVTITTTASHGLSVGQTVQLSGLTEGRGFSSGHLTGLFTVVTVPTGTTFTLTLATTATSGGNLGGTIGVATPITQRGSGTIWKTADNEQSKVSNGGKVAYNFLITGSTTVFTVNPGTPLPTGWGSAAVPGSGFICYSKILATASAATIKAGGSQIICK